MGAEGERTDCCGLLRGVAGYSVAKGSRVER